MSAINPAEHAEREVLELVLMLDSLGKGLGSRAFEMLQQTQVVEVYGRVLRIKRPLDAWIKTDDEFGVRGIPTTPEHERAGLAADENAELVEDELVAVWKALRDRLMNFWRENA